MTSLRAPRALRLITVLMVVGPLAACGGASTSPSTIATPAATIVTETFTGTVQPPVSGVFQQNAHNFTVTTAGNITVTMTAAGPPATILMGIGVGTPNAAGACVFLSGGTTQGVASATPQLSGALGASGTYCVVVGDIGNVLQPVTYSVTVAHT